ncbi:MAG: adenylate/guanylate cyclase domain-containing protein [Verrucomicrobia bacterium]|nr:adenylate/guanylate cyclase domain-containing protein [Verrucomicrobiota bacterium]
MESLEPVRKVLAHRKRSDLAKLLANSRLELIPSNISMYNVVFSELRTAVVHSPIEDCDRLKALSADDYETIFQAMHEVYPPRTGRIEITNIEWVIDTATLLDDTRDLRALQQAIETQKLTMIADATGIGVDASAPVEYEDRHDVIDAGLEELGLANPNPYGKLWQWRARWHKGDMPSYRDRRQAVEDMYADVMRRIKRRLEATDDYPGSPTRPPVDELDTETDAKTMVSSAVEETRSEGFETWAGGKEVTLAIVVSDVVGSTALGRELGEEGMRQVIGDHFAHAEELIETGEGYPVDLRGDATVSAFRSAPQALDFALAFRRDPGHERVSVRLGIHVGPIRADKPEYASQTFSIATRLCQQAGPNQIRVSAATKEHIEQEHARRHSKLEWAEHADSEIRGLPERCTVWSLEPD